MLDTILAFVLILAAFLTALAALIVFAFVNKSKERGLHHTVKSEKNRVTFLFENETLADSTQTARQILSSGNATGSDWNKFLVVLKPRFEDLEDLPWQAIENGGASLVSSDGTSHLQADFIHGMMRLELTDAETSDSDPDIDRYSLQAMQDELAIHREAAEHVPFLNWRENQMGEITWANHAYLKITEILHADTGIASWPPPHLFQTQQPLDGDTTSGATWRTKLEMPEGDDENWFDIHQTLLGDHILFTAIPIDNVVKAETSLSEFVTTLTGTFAHLPIGLAIFDNKRKLSLFNPALTDLTMLPAEFLCGQPTLFAFLDRLRDKRMMPEPKNYKSWRQEMSELEEKAVNGTYLETWFLPTGQTYRVTGRPHPGGGVAFLIEDVSSEMSLTHRFQAELETGQSVLDSLDKAIAVFTAGGVLSMSNTAYTKLWDSDPSTTLNDISISEATKAWSNICAPTPVWHQLHGFISEQGERKEWTAPVSLQDGRVLTCRIIPMIQGTTLVTFELSVADPISHSLEPVRAEVNQGLPA